MLLGDQSNLFYLAIDLVYKSNQVSHKISKMLFGKNYKRQWCFFDSRKNKKNYGSNILIFFGEQSEV